MEVIRLTSKKLLTQAIPFAKKLAEPFAKNLITLVKADTGMMAHILQKKIREGGKLIFYKSRLSH